MNTMSPTNTEKMYGWYSPTAQFNTRHIITYLRASDNQEVIVSSVTKTPHDSGTKFPDIKFIGELSKFVSSKPTNGLCNLYKY